MSRWKGDAQVAYTISHDDVYEPATCGLFTYGYPELRRRGLRAALGAICASCATFDRWSDLNALIAGGREIMNHSWGHKNLVTETRDSAQQVEAAKTTLDAKLSAPTEFFIFSYDSLEEEAVRAVKSAGHVGARAWSRGVNASEADALAARFDVYGPDHSIYAADPLRSQNVLNALVDEAVTSGGWALRELHGVEDASWQAVPLTEYQRHLDYLSSLVQRGLVWVSGPSAIIRYRRAFGDCGKSSVRNVLTFPDAGTRRSRTAP